MSPERPALDVRRDLQPLVRRLDVRRTVRIVVIDRILIGVAVALLGPSTSGSTVRNCPVPGS